MFLPIGDDQEHDRTPYVNYGFLALNLAAFALFCLPHPRPGVAETYALIPASLRPHTLITHMFLHGNLLHLLGNMLFLWLFGRLIEERLGHAGYAVFYLASGLGAAALHIFTAPDPNVPALGSSGAISGAIGACLIFCPRANIKVFIWFWWTAGIYPIPAAAWVALWFVEQVWFASAGFGGASYYGHIGGFLAGAGIAWVVRFIAGRLRDTRAVPLEAKDAASLLEPRRPFAPVSAEEEPVFIDESVDSYAVVTLRDGTAAPGVPARRAPRAQAEKIRADLQASGVPCALIIDVPANHPPAPERVESLSWDDRMLRLRVAGQIVPLPWSSPCLVVAARVGAETFVDLIAGRKAAYRVPAAPSVALTRVDPRRRKEEAATLDRLGEDCVRKGLRSSWEWLTFPTPAEYEDYLFRLYHLARAPKT